MPQINFILSDELVKDIDQATWKLQLKFRTHFARQVFALFAPDLNCLAMAQFLHRYYPPAKIDELVAEIIREAEVAR
jgi:hypothetical protein